MIFHGLSTKEKIVESIANAEITSQSKKGSEGETIKIEYNNSVCAFDIETSSFYDGKNKRNIMYIWMLEINGHTVIGRTWEEFHANINYISDMCGFDNEHRLVIYVHNLSYEFQYLRHQFEWTEVFAPQNRKVMKAVTGGLEFRCSFVLSGLSLDATTLVNHDIKKMVGDLDYSLIRHANTPLTDKELGYCLSDVDKLSAYIDEQMDLYDRDITKIPLTNTGRVRQYFRDLLLPQDNKSTFFKYYKKIHSLTIDSPMEYKMLKDAFAGGFTHANYQMAGKVHEHVQSMDFTSSYPAVMVSEKFPMQKTGFLKGHYYDELNNERYLRIESLRKPNKLYIMTVKFYDIVQVAADSYISGSKCQYLENPVYNNGRIMQADELVITITNIDFDVIEKAYTFLDYEIGYAIEYEAEYLPTNFIKGLQKLYADKTELKDVKGREVDYLNSKGMFNSSYGMTVEDFVRDEIDYVTSQEWDVLAGDPIEAQCDAYNKNPNRFLYYPWGIFITAYARRNLWTGILELGDDYIYSDTDSVKYINPENHTEYFDNYNKQIWNKIEIACKYHKLDPEGFAPKTIKGVRKPLGVWDDDGSYLRFKTLGAKRYLVEFNDDGVLKCKCTIAGVSKKYGSAYFNESLELTGKDPFELFDDYLTFPKEYSGRQVVTYVDEEQSGKVMDYLGQELDYYEMSSVHMEAGEYNLTLSPIFAELIGIYERNYIA